jgi:hypothetical protein
MSECPSAAPPAPFAWASEVADSFPPAFRAFLQTNDIHPENYNIASVPRYFRLVRAATLRPEELAASLHARCEAVEWLPGYWRLPGDVKIAGSDAYRRAQIFGIDGASGAAVAALDPRPGEHVLDLCCAPGAKLCAIADATHPTGTVTGVDVSEERLAACRTLCTKYGAANARLFLCDGRAFCEPPPAADGRESARGAHEGVTTPAAGARSKRKRGAGEPGAPFFAGALVASHAAASAAAAASPDEAPSRRPPPPQPPPPPQLYDKVLVDA